MSTLALRQDACLSKAWYPVNAPFLAPLPWAFSQPRCRPGTFLHSQDFDCDMLNIHWSPQTFAPPSCITVLFLFQGLVSVPLPSWPSFAATDNPGPSPSQNDHSGLMNVRTGPRGFVTHWPRTLSGNITPSGIRSNKATPSANKGYLTPGGFYRPGCFP